MLTLCEQLCWLGLENMLTATSVLDVTQNNLKVRLQSCSFGECRVPFIAITPQSTMIWSGSTC